MAGDARGNVRDQCAHVIETVRVTGGFLDGICFDFNPGLNCLIGARGTGKTTGLELVRYALDALPGARENPEGRRRIESLLKDNFSGGRVEVAVRTKEGLSYVVSRVFGEEPIVLNEEGKPTGIKLQGSGFFAADIYSQNEVEAIADRSTSQLSLIDNFEAEQVAAINEQIRGLRNDLAANASKIEPLQKRIEELNAALAQVPQVQEKLAGLAEVTEEADHGLEAEMQRKSARDREARAVQAADRALREHDTALERLRGNLAGATAATGNTDDGRPNDDLVKELQGLLGECSRGVDAAIDTGRGRIADAIAGLADLARRLKLRHDEQDMAYRQLVDKHEADRKQATERMKWEKVRNDLREDEQERKEKVVSLEALMKQREELLCELSDLRDERFGIRHEVAQRITDSVDEAIRVTVTQGGNTENLERILSDALRGAGIHHGQVAKKLATTCMPDQLVEAIRADDQQTLIDVAELNPNQAQKAIDALADPATLFEIETVELVDEPCIELKSGGEYKPSQSLSTGQKCTTILPILLLDSENPLLVDQPEDNLDNRFIFECVVNSLRRVKQHRQLIFVTHNPNIPVLGDAEQVFVLDSEGAAGSLAAVGTVDDCKEHIVTLLEGGEEAFKQRRDAYAYQ